MYYMLCTMLKLKSPRTASLFPSEACVLSRFPAWSSLVNKCRLEPFSCPTLSNQSGPTSRGGGSPSTPHAAVYHEQRVHPVQEIAVFAVSSGCDVAGLVALCGLQAMPSRTMSFSCIADVFMDFWLRLSPLVDTLSVAFAHVTEPLLLQGVKTAHTLWNMKLQVTCSCNK